MKKIKSPVIPIIVIIAIIVFAANWALERKYAQEEIAIENNLYVMQSDGSLFKITDFDRGVERLQKENKGSPMIVETFRKQFPKATNVEWEMENKTFEVDFKMDFSEQEILFAPNGKIVMKKQEIKISELPEEIKLQLKRKYKNETIDDIQKITKGKSVYYQIELESPEEKQMFFSENGSLVKSI